MRRRWFWIPVIAIIIYLGVRPELSDRPRPGSRGHNEAKQVGIALQLYAQDHEGRLPATLKELMPDYFPADESRLIRNMTLTMPRASLKDMPADYLIALKQIPEDGNSVVPVYADLSRVPLK